MYQPIDFRNLPHLRAEPLPTMYDLPSEDPEEPGLPDQFHEYQPQLLRETCQLPDISADEYLTCADLNLYYDSRNPLWHKRPDWFLVLGAAPGRSIADLRWSYVTWIEQVNPFLVVELLSPGTESEDLGQTLREVNRPPTKWQVYEQILKVPYYALYDRYNLEFRLFRLVATRYEEVQVTHQKYWFEELNLGLGIFPATYAGYEGQWLRWYDGAGQPIPTDLERANQSRQLAEQESQRAEQESQRADRLAARLRALGIDPNSIDD
jgi:Uma2 family endonuclease